MTSFSLVFPASFQEGCNFGVPWEHQAEEKNGESQFLWEKNTFLAVSLYPTAFCFVVLVFNKGQCVCVLYVCNG